MPEAIRLSPNAAACLEALRAGETRIGRITLAARLKLTQIRKALETLETAGLVSRRSIGEWRLCPGAKQAKITIVPPPVTRGRKPGTAESPGASEARMLAALDRPRRGRELIAMLNVSHQRVQQLYIALSALGLVRAADPEHPLFVIARTDDTTLLLTHNQDRVLSAFPETDATTPEKIAQFTSLRTERVSFLANILCDLALLETAGRRAHSVLYRLTAAGRSHWQRTTTGRHAQPPSPTKPLLRSPYLLAVMQCVHERGPIRAQEIARILDLPRPIVHSVLQYLRRRDASAPSPNIYNPPYILTQSGRDELEAMLRERSGA